MRYATYSEYLRLPEFRAVVRSVVERSGGVCELCGVNNATVPHHIKYCRWGDIDVPENILHLCDICHENAHTCQVCGRVALKAKHIKAKLRQCDKCNETMKGEKLNNG